MKNTKRRGAGSIFTKINIMSYHDKKKTLPWVDKNSHFCYHTIIIKIFNMLKNWLYYDLYIIPRKPRVGIKVVNLYKLLSFFFLNVYKNYLHVQ